MPSLKIVDNATCTFCGCVCDDMVLKVEDHKIVEAKNACVRSSASAGAYPCRRKKVTSGNQ